MMMTVAAAEAQSTIRLGGSIWLGDGPTKVADALGYFNRSIRPGEPRIEVLNLNSGYDAVALLMNGELDFALAATTPVALALMGAIESQPGREPVVLASLALSNQTHKLVVHPGRDITEPAALRGRRVGVMHGTSSHYGWWHFADFNDLNDAEVELVFLPVREMPDAMLEGRIDAALIWEPWDAILSEALGQPPLYFELRMLYTVNWLLLADRRFVQAQPELVERVLIAYRDALRFIDRHPERSAEIKAPYHGLSIEELLHRSQGILWRLGLNWSVVASMGAQFEWLESWPELAGRPAPEPNQYLLGAPLARVAPELVTLPSYLLMDWSAEGSAR